MAYTPDHIKRNGSFELSMKRDLLKTFDELSADIAGGGAFVPTAAPTALTNSTGGTANDVVQAVAQATAGTGDVDASNLNPILTVINNNFADLAAKVNAMRTALVASGILT